MGGGLREVSGPVQAFDRWHNLVLNAAEVRRIAIAMDPSADRDARALKAQVLRDLGIRRLQPGEQLHFIGYSGGGTIAFNAAAMLETAGIRLDYIVGIGSVAFRGKPGNVSEWIRMATPRPEFRH
jgi:thioesterase domain-containing protein